VAFDEIRPTSGATMNQATTTETTTLDGRARILRAGRELFTQNGFSAVSMQQIADAAGVNKATLYHHFVDKEALFVEVLRREFLHVHQQLNAMVPEHGSLRSQLLQVANRMFSTPSPDIGRLMADLRECVSAERRTELMTSTAPPWDSLVSLFERAQRRGEIFQGVDAALLSRLFFVMVASQMGWSKFGACAQPDEQTAATIVGVLLDGVGIRPDQSVGTLNDIGAAEPF
jgi:AcrR family transcriptional regulator